MIVNDKMELFNFYIDKDTKEKCIAKLTEYIPNTTKGTLSALIRTLLWQFANTENVNSNLIEAVKLNYIVSKNRNKRSNM